MIKYPSSIDEMVDHYKELLSISDEPIMLGCTIMDQQYQSDLSWNKDSKTWFLRFNVNVPKFAFAHELGHVYFAKKKTNYIHFAYYGNDKNTSDIDNRLYLLLNNLLDCFINYNLTLFDEIYPLYRSMVFEYLEKLDIFKGHIASTEDPIILLSWFILFFIDHHYLLNKQDQEEKPNEMTQLRSLLKKQLLDSSSEIDDSILRNFIEKLKNFEKIKSSTDPTTIVNFFIEVLQATTLWDEETLKTRVELLFPGIL